MVNNFQKRFLFSMIQVSLFSSVCQLEEEAECLKRGKNEPLHCCSHGSSLSLMYKVHFPRACCLS